MGLKTLFLLVATLLIAWPARAESPGIRLHFQVDPRYLVLHSLEGRYGRATAEERQLLRGFQDRAMEFDKDACRFLIKYDWPVGNLAGRGEMGQRAERLIEHLREDPSFETIEAQAQAAAGRAEQEWNEDLEFSHAVMSELTGLKFDLDLDVLVTHPAQTNGISFGKDKILWTYRSDFPHYNTVYLWHEVMHKYIQATVRADQVDNPSHALIELLTDNELRLRLGGTAYPPFEGHPQNEPFRQKLLPGWRAYLQQSERHILDYLKSAEAFCGG